MKSKIEDVDFERKLVVKPSSSPTLFSLRFREGKISQPHGVGTRGLNVRIKLSSFKWENNIHIIITVLRLHINVAY